MKSIAEREAAKMEKAMFCAAYFGMFNITLFAQEAMTTNNVNWEQLGACGILAGIACTAAVVCFKAYKKSQEDRIDDLKKMLTESEKSREELKTILTEVTKRKEQ